jgi:hypothetical protein
MAGDWNHADASFGADPGADAASRAFVHVEQMSSSEAFGQLEFLIGILHSKCAFEDVLDAFVHFSKKHG